MTPISPADPLAKSADLTAGNLGKLQELFPEAFSEGKVDFEVLKQLLGGAVDEREEKYGLNWHGKRAARRLALTPSTGTLRPGTKEESREWDTTRNLMIEGDNLEVLKLLQKSYTGKVKLIYIDPPYNTGKDFVYPDNFHDNIANYKELTGQTEGGVTMRSNTEASGRFHTDWLNMMYARLKLARNLLSTNGVILVSINDIEGPALRHLLDNIFGEENFLCQFIWNNEGNVDQQSKIKGVHEYIIAYSRTLETFPCPTVIDPNVEETSKLYNDQIENSITKNGPANPPSEIILPVGFPAAFEEGTIAQRSDQWPHILDNIIVAKGKLTTPARVKSGWSSRNLLELFINNGCIPIADSTGKETWFALTASGAIYGYKKRSDSQGHVLSVIRNVGTTKQNSNMLADWGIDFSYPKPLFLIRYLTQVFTDSKQNDVILDFFAGSGTTGHAVMAQNAADGGNRRYICVQLPEPTRKQLANGLYDTTPAWLAGYPTIAEITKARLRRAADKIRAEWEAKQKQDKEKKGQGEEGTLALEPSPLPQVPSSPLPDLGFRVYKLDSSNIRTWDPDRANLEKSLEEHAAGTLKPDRTEADVLTELLLKLGLDLCTPVATRTMAGKTVTSVGAGTLYACLDRAIATADIEALAAGLADWHAEQSPDGEPTVLFRDDAFADDIAKTNLTAILEQRGLKNIRSL